MSGLLFSVYPIISHNGICSSLVCSCAMQQQNNIMQSEKGRQFTVLTWNVKGLNQPVKRGKVLAHLKSLSSDIIFLQETHLNKNEYIKLRCQVKSPLFI